MNTFITHLKPIFSPARTRNSRGFTYFNGIPVVFRCALVMLSVLAGAGVLQAQQTVDPLTITKDGKVGIGTPAPANKLSVAGNADFSGDANFNGSVSIRRATPGVALEVGQNQAIRLGNAYMSSGGDGANLSNHAWFDGSAWQSDGTAGGMYQISATSHNWYLHNGKGVLGKVMTINSDGRVGIGTSNTQFAQLSVAGGATPALRLDANSGVAAMSIGGTGQLNVDAPGVTGGRFVVKDSGNVGIGTNNPTRAKLEISGGVNQTVRQYGFLNLGNPTGKFDVPGPDAVTVPYSIWADRRVAAEEFNAFSDERLKNIQGRSDSAMDLRTLLSIEITDYRHKDVLAKGNGTYKKVTGQQVEKVFPQAVSKHTEVVPDIYRPASIQDGWIALATDLKKGDRVRLISEKAAGIYEVLEVAPNKFRTDLKPEGDRIFVYGREVKDFLAVDYEAISMLNVSATQQIKKEKDEEVKALQEENAILRGQLTEQEKRLSELEARDKARDEKLAAIEAMLLSGNNSATRASSLKKVE